MPSALPEGEAVPDDGALPYEALESVASSPLGMYVHVPFCLTRCGYCDFNTYTSAELGSEPGTSRQAYLDAVAAEVDLAARVLGRDHPPISTVFFGGGTPTLLKPSELIGILDLIRGRFGLTDDAEVTTEANPESVTPESLHALREGGINRISFGMQSSVTSVLSVLQRGHRPGRIPQVVEWARTSGFESVSLDLIYGTPGESLQQWRRSLTDALACAPDHVSAYALIVEEGTRLATRIRRGELTAPDDDDMADKYLLADALLTEAGLSWYELSNWSRPGHECRHNLAYWQGHNWWGIGPGAHSHIGGVRFWNRKHPRAYSTRLAAGLTPAQGREVLTPPLRKFERVLLELRLAKGLPRSVLTRSEQSRVADLVNRGLMQDLPETAALTLTVRGRLLADAVTRDLLD
ncbi:MAG: coproporphyrinogen III oxidase [Micropruina sp.]|nr:coproporphyrinogen III oxidase [Micropruina sp.]